ncbi:MAG TPA: nucleotidyl transferase AbiEii/AbiGii toxin family protein [Gemmatimonadaceae bacterium]|nr:nucleotidyl transferase AbiEii/AbiGii toxin family protein [Gemmatimonadaceae bacterium]
MVSPQPPDFARLLAELTRELETRGIAFMLIGGQAVLLHGIPRLTEDIDVTLGAGPEAIAAVRDVCVTLGLEPLPRDVDVFVRDTFVLPARARTTGVRVDFIFSTTPYEHQAIARSVRVPMSGVEVPFASAEDLLIHKLFAGRARDLEDARGVVRRKGTELDWDYLRHWAAAFATVPGREGMPAQLEALRTAL